MSLELDQSWVSKSVWKPNLFQGKVAFITGGNGSICSKQATALVLLGANVAIIGRNVEKTQKCAQEIQALRPGSKVLGLGDVDVRSVQSLKKAADKTVEELGRIDFVICGAAGNYLASFNHVSSNAFKTVVDIDLLGSYNTVKACYDELKKNKGCILFVSATLHYYGVPFQIHVGAAKAGVDALCNALAVELGPLGIRSVGIAPGPIANTEGMSRLARDTAEGIAARIPLQRMGSTTDIADATVFLFSPAASYITGEVMVVDGGSWQVGQGGTQGYPVALLGSLRDGTNKL